MLNVLPCRDGGNWATICRTHWLLALGVPLYLTAYLTARVNLPQCRQNVDNLEVAIQRSLTSAATSLLNF